MPLFKLNLEGSKIIFIKKRNFPRHITRKINYGDIYSASMLELSDYQGSLAPKRG